MKHELLEILACPVDKSYPLELFSLSEEKRETKTNRGIISWTEIVEGILYCPRCTRWYPIMDEIPELLPDELRDRERELNFLRKYIGKVPKYITDLSKPFNLG